MAKGNFVIENTWSKWIIHVTLPDGTQKDISGLNKDELIRDAKRLIGSGAGKTGRPKGAKSFAGRQYVESDIKRMFNQICLAANGVSIAAHAYAMEELAQKMIDSVSRLSSKGRNFNSYTGNLRNSYVASVIHNKSVKMRVRPAVKSKVGKIEYGKNGGRYAEIIDKHHAVSGFIYKNKKKGIRYKTKKYLKKEGRIVRYLRKWEKEDGYLNNATAGYRNWSKINRGALQSPNTGGIRSAIVIENVAPYSDSVQRKHYRVLENASAESVIGDVTLKQRQLIRVATKRMLKEAGFIIK